MPGNLAGYANEGLPGQGQGTPFDPRISIPAKKKRETKKKKRIASDGSKREQVNETLVLVLQS
jgi:hypothetical protein